MIVKDRFLYFTFNGRHSSEFDLFYVNGGEDITLPFTPVVKYNTISPLYQNRSYIVGKSIEAKQLKLRVAADNKELSDVDDILEWLNPNSIGELSFDHRPDYVHNVFISSVGSPTLVPWETVNNRIKNVIYFDIVFETHGTHTSETRESYILPDILSNDTEVLFEPDRLLPIYHRESTLVHQFINWSSTPQSLELVSSSTGLKVKQNANGIAKTMYEYNGLPIGTVVQLNTEIGALHHLDTILEASFRDKDITNEGPLLIQPGLIFSGNIQINVSGSNATVELDSRFKPLNGSTKVYMQIQEEDDDSIFLKPNSDNDYWFKGYYAHENDKLKIPKYAQGVITYSNGKTLLSFSNVNLKATTGKAHVKIAKAVSVSIEPVGGKTNLEFKYKKER